MPAALPFDLASAIVGRDLALYVTWRESRSDAGIGQLGVGEEVARFLREACAETRRRVEARTPREYEADIHLEDNECIVLEDAALIAASLVARYFSDQQLPLLTAHQLPAGSLTSYGVVVGVGAGRRAYVQRANPVRSARGGGILTVLSNALTRIEEPVFGLEAAFDVIVSPESVIALDQGAFEALFRVLAEEAIPGWVSQIAAVLPFAAGSAEQLEARCVRDSRLRHKLKAIVDRGHLHRVTTRDIRGYIRQLDLPAADFLDGQGKLVFNSAKPRDLLDFLNEDLFLGGLSRERFRSDRKAVDRG